MHDDNWSPWRKTTKRGLTHGSQFYADNRYDLYAVCYHQGDTLETGHYTAACRNPFDHNWYKFDDQKVTKVDNEHINEEIVNNEAYILFYQRRKSDGSECSGQVRHICLILIMTFKFNTKITLQYAFVLNWKHTFELEI